MKGAATVGRNGQSGWALACAWICFTACAPAETRSPEAATSCAQELIVLGTAQDAGAPQIGNPSDPGWADPTLRLTATSLALVNHGTGRRFLFEATPNITEQLYLLDQLAPSDKPGLGLDGVFLTHAHIGHYAGLMFFGHEAAGASKIPVHAMPRMKAYLEENGPWSQLVEFENILLDELAESVPFDLGDGVSVTPLQVPHRDEFSETVGFLIDVAGRKALFLPDIDRWETWESLYGHRFEPILEQVEYAFVDATFYDDNELPGRDMSAIPHPRVTGTMALLEAYPDTVRSRIQFIHTNHTNPIRYATSAESRAVLDAGFGIARTGARYCLAE